MEAVMAAATLAAEEALEASVKVETSCWRGESGDNVCRGGSTEARKCAADIAEGRRRCRRRETGMVMTRGRVAETTITYTQAERDDV